MIEPGALLILTDQQGPHTADPRREPDALLRVVAVEAVGALLDGGSTRMQARRQWLADHLQLGSALILDAGAVKALLAGRSLLPVGVSSRREATSPAARWVACRNVAGEEVARGLVNYSVSECRRIARRPTGEIEKLLGYVGEPELIHRESGGQPSVLWTPRDIENDSRIPPGKAGSLRGRAQRRP